MKEHFTKPGFAEGLPQEIQDILPPAKFFHVGDRLCLLITQNAIVYWDVEKGENVPLKAGDKASPAWMQSQVVDWCSPKGISEYSSANELFYHAVYSFPKAVQDRIILKMQHYAKEG